MIPTNAVAGVRLVSCRRLLGTAREPEGLGRNPRCDTFAQNRADSGAAGRRARHRRSAAEGGPGARRTARRARGCRGELAPLPRLSASVRAGLFRARYSAAVLILPVDLPWLECREIARLIARWRLSRRSVVARRVGERAGTPLVLPRRLYAQAQRIGGDLGLRNLVNGLPRTSSSCSMFRRRRWMWIRPRISGWRDAGCAGSNRAVAKAVAEASANPENLERCQRRVYLGTRRIEVGGKARAWRDGCDDSSFARCARSASTAASGISTNTRLVSGGSTESPRARRPSAR